MTKRAFDIFVSLCGIIAISPLFIIISLWIICDSRGGILYRQKRVGKHGREFNLLKFRSMKTGSDKEGLLTIGDDDPRITRAGRFIRKCKLDEFPQLLNVFKGDMSIVGPRPEVKKYVDLYNAEQKKILSVRPGLTDPASIEYVNENEMLALSDNPEKTYVNEIIPEKLQLGLEYINQKSMFIDLKIIIKTLAAILKSKF